MVRCSDQHPEHLTLSEPIEFLERVELLVVGKLIGTIFHSAFADFYLIIAAPAEICPLDNL